MVLEVIQSLSRCHAISVRGGALEQLLFGIHPYLWTSSGVKAATFEEPSAAQAPEQIANPVEGANLQRPSEVTPDEPWAAYALHWGRLGPPLRPVAEDVQRLHAAWTSSVDPAILSSRKIDILMLGVTPELACHRWAHEFQLRAIDASEVMIKAVWPGDTDCRKAFCGSWMNTPFADASFDLILSDCGLTPLAAPGQVAALGRELSRLLRPDGRVVMRHFAQSANPKPVDQLFQLVESGTVPSFHELKLRLLLAMAAMTPAVRLGEAWECFKRQFPDRNQLAERLGCALEIISTIDAYRDQDARYAFPTLPELAQRFRDFSLSAGPSASYPLAEFCPVFSLTPRP